jgi:hypothetical protein
MADDLTAIEINFHLTEWEKSRVLDRGRLDVVHTDGDGHCLFHALANLAHDEQHANALHFYCPYRRRAKVMSFRRAVAEQLQANWEELQVHHTEIKAQTKEIYLQQLISGEAYGGEPEMHAALALFPGVSLAVWSKLPDGRTVLHLTFRRKQREGYRHTFWNIFSHGEHYSWMRKRATLRSVGPIIADIERPRSAPPASDRASAPRTACASAATRRPLIKRKFSVPHDRLADQLDAYRDAARERHCRENDAN